MNDETPISQSIRDLREAQEWKPKKKRRKTLIPIKLDPETVDLLQPIIFVIAIMLLIVFVLLLVAAGQYWHCKVEDHDQTIGQCFWVEEHIKHQRERSKK